jgi:hypothetical protein
VGLEVLLKNAPFGWRSALSAAIKSSFSVRVLAPEVDYSVVDYSVEERPFRAA